MKKMLLALFLVVGMAFSGQLHAQKVGFYYYPDVNVYYNTKSHQYAYNDNGNWTYHRTLPHDMRVTGHSHVTVWGTGKEDVWMHNDEHRTKYKDWDKRHHH